MNIRFLEQKPKDAAAALPASERKKEIKSLETLIASMIRMARGSSSELKQPFKTPFGTKVDRIEQYPYVIKEDEPDTPFIELVVNVNHPTLLWARQSSQNTKWVLQYYGYLIKLAEHKNENLEAAIKATENWEPKYPFNNLTPPPQPAKVTTHNTDPWQAHRDHLHYVKGATWDEKQTKPTWWNEQLNIKLNPPKPKKQDEPK